MSDEQEPIKILVVDDDEMICDVLQEELENYGYQVTKTYNATQALTALQQDTFHIVLSDLRMPGGDGLYLINLINANFAHKPKFFLCTGFEDLTIEEARKNGVEAIFAKPFNYEAIVSTLEKSMKQKPTTNTLKVSKVKHPIKI